MYSWSDMVIVTGSVIILMLSLVSWLVNLLILMFLPGLLLPSTCQQLSPTIKFFMIMYNFFCILFLYTYSVHPNQNLSLPLPHPSPNFVVLRYISKLSSLFKIVYLDSTRFIPWWCCELLASFIMLALDSDSTWLDLESDRIWFDLKLHSIVINRIVL